MMRSLSFPLSSTLIKWWEPRSLLVTQKQQLCSTMAPSHFHQIVVGPKSSNACIRKSCVAILSPLSFFFFLSSLCCVFLRRRWLIIFLPTTMLLAPSLCGARRSQFHFTLRQIWVLIKSQVDMWERSTIGLLHLGYNVVLMIIVS